MITCLQLGANDLHMIQLIPLPSPSSLASSNPDWFNLSGADLTRCPGKEAIKRAFVY